MKKILLLAFLSVFSFKIYSEEAVVKVSAKILTPLKVDVIQHLYFGDIFKGGRNFTSKNNGEIKITGNGRVRLLWKDSLSSDYQSMDTNLNITMSNNKGSSFIAVVSPTSIGDLSDFTITENSEKIVNIKGKIEKLDRALPEDDYNGAILIRAEYLNN